MTYFEWKEINPKQGGKYQYCYLREAIWEDGKAIHKNLAYLGSAKKSNYTESGFCYICDKKSELWFDMCADCLGELIKNAKEKIEELEETDFEEMNRKALCHLCLGISPNCCRWEKKEKRKLKKGVLGQNSYKKIINSVVLCDECFESLFGD